MPTATTTARPKRSLLSFGNPGHLIAAIGICDDVDRRARRPHRRAAQGRADARSTRSAASCRSPPPGSRLRPSPSARSRTSALPARRSATATPRPTAPSPTPHAHDDCRRCGRRGRRRCRARASTPSGGGSDRRRRRRPDPASVPGALTQGSNGQPAATSTTTASSRRSRSSRRMSRGPAPAAVPRGHHDGRGLPALQAAGRGRCARSREQFKTPADATAAGYVRTTSDVPYMGEHYLNYDYVRKGIFDPAHPAGPALQQDRQRRGEARRRLVPADPGHRRRHARRRAGGLRRQPRPLARAHRPLPGRPLRRERGRDEGELHGEGRQLHADLRWMMHVWVAPVPGQPGRRLRLPEQRPVPEAAGSREGLERAERHDPQ